MLWIIVGLVVKAAGAGLTVVGIRGLRRGSVRRCRGCDFDLTGLPEDAGACPECGRGIAGGRGVVKGTRRPVRVLALSSPALVLIGLALVVYGWASAGRPAAVAAGLPAWALERLAIYGDQTWRDASLAELRTRMADDALSGARLRRLIDLALDVQGDTAPRAVWTPAWSDVLEDAHRAGMLSEDEVRRYVEQALGTEILTRRRVIAGRDIDVVHRVAAPRLAPDRPATPAEDWRFLLATAPPELRLVPPGEEPVFVDAWPQLPMWSTLFSVGNATNSNRLSVPADAAPGAWRLHVLVPGLVGPESLIRRHRAGGMRVGEDPPPGLWEAIRTYAADVEVLPADTDPTELVPWIREEGIAERLADLVQLTDLRTSGWGLDVNVLFQPVPVPLAFEGFVRAAGRPETETRIGTYTLTPVEHGWGLGHGVRLEQDLGEVVDVVLRPSLDAAYAHPEMEGLWAGEIWFEGVRLGDPSRQSPVAPTRVRAIEP